MIAAAIGLAACNTEKVSPTDDQGDELAIEGKMENNLWVIDGEDLPTAQLRQDFERMEFYVEDNLNYTWTWIGKGAQKSFTFKGDTYYERSNHTHSSGSGIWNIAVNVVTINGMSLPSGWYGIFTYEDENHMSLNIEPDVQGWEVHPTADKGLGSGTSGNGSVYKFYKKAL